MRRGRQFPEGNLRGRSITIHSNQRGIAAGEINGKVFIGLKIPEFTHPLCAYAAGRQVGNCAVLELHPGVGDVHFVGKHGQAHCAHIAHGRIHQPEHEIKIVYHQIKNHIHIEAARAEDPQAMDFKEHRM